MDIMWKFLLYLFAGNPYFVNASGNLQQSSKSLQSPSKVSLEELTSKDNHFHIYKKRVA